MTSTLSIAERVGEFEAGAQRQMPGEILTVFRANQKELTAAGVPAQAAVSGTHLPDAPLLDALGAATSLHAVTGGRPNVIVFYRGGWCPYCNIALKAYQEQLLPELARRGVGLVAVSPQRPDGSLSTQEKNELAFPVVSDPGNALARRLGIVMPPPGAEVRSAQASLGLDLAAVNVDGAEDLPMPTVIVADAGHTIRWIDVHPDYTTRTEVADVLAALDTLR